jgi:hypothetical protein
MRTAMIEQFHHKSVRAMLDGLSYITTTGEGQWSTPVVEHST